MYPVANFAGPSECPIRQIALACILCCFLWCRIAILLIIFSSYILYAPVYCMLPYCLKCRMLYRPLFMLGPCYCSLNQPDPRFDTQVQLCALRTGLISQIADTYNLTLLQYARLILVSMLCRGYFIPRKLVSRSNKSHQKHREVGDARWHDTTPIFHSGGPASYWLPLL